MIWPNLGSKRSKRALERASKSRSFRVPYPADHKAKTRARIIESARVMFNRRGFEQVSIDEIMKHAGLTRGGFYHHFASKDELYAEAVRSFTTCSPLSRRLAAHEGPELRGPELARLLVELYLSDEVLDDPDQHCPLVALPSDVARAGQEPRAAYTQLLTGMLKIYRGAFPRMDAEAERKAQLVLSLCVGAMVIARTTTDAKLRAELRRAAREQALTILAG
jgi:AcrR family transcriptional regulator